MSARVPSRCAAFDREGLLSTRPGTMGRRGVMLHRLSFRASTFAFPDIAPRFRPFQTNAGSRYLPIALPPRGEAATDEIRRQSLSPIPLRIDKPLALPFSQRDPGCTSPCLSLAVARPDQAG